MVGFGLMGVGGEQGVGMMCIVGQCARGFSYYIESMKYLCKYINKLTTLNIGEAIN